MLIRSYRVAFIALFVGLLVATVIAVSANGYRRAADVALDLSADIVAEMSQRVRAQTSALFERSRDFAELAALAVSERGTDEAEPLLRLFGRQLALLPALESVYVGTPQGELIQARDAPQLATRVLRRSADGGASERLIYRGADFAPIARINGSGAFDPRERGWYRQAAARSGVFWTGVYRFAGSGRRGITGAVAVRDDAGALQAVVGVDIALDSLSEFLTGQRIARGGVALIIGPEQRLVAYPHEVAVAAGGGADETLPPIESLQDAWILDAYRDVHAGRLRESANQSVEYTLTRSGGRRYLAHASAFPADIGNDWELLVVVPEASLLEGARRLFSESAMVALILVLVAAIAVSLLSLKLFVPLKRLVRNTELIREFRFAEVQRVRSHYTEIQAMDQAIWQMSQGLRSLEKFVPADIGRQLIQSGKRAEPDAEVRELSLLLTGVAGLGALCDALPPERIIALLAEQLDAFTAAILRCRGTIDNFLGESILAFWGAPVAMEDGPERACRAALACRDAEAVLHQQWAKRAGAGEPAPAPNLFSVHYGRAIVGTIGSRQRMSWTAIGDNVALGWDLHQLNRRYGTRILVSGEVRERVADQFWLRRVDVLPVGGGRRSLEVYELVDARERAPAPEQQTYIQRYESGLAAMLDADWDSAEAVFAELAARWPNDPAVALMHARCSTRDACYWPGPGGPRDDSVAGPLGSDWPCAGSGLGDGPARGRGGPGEG